MKFIKYFVMLFICVFTISNVKALDIPVADTTYNSDWDGTLIINESKTIKISGINHDNTGTGYGAAIKIADNSTVNIVFEGENHLTGNSSVISAGIEVEEGSTVNIYGMENSSLTVTGGNFSAGIGGIGYGSVSTTNPKAGNINIYSGNIIAIGGIKGSGIGSGYHSSAGDINIYGGNITALGTGNSAGIGSGYGTSGGAASAAGVGFYNGGNINITGDSVVRAAGYHINFDDFDPYNLDTLYGDGYDNTRSAGIGGGYGASSGNITIGGNADVIAIGSSGGAAIGSGRGTSKVANYDEEHFDVNITIKENANIMAFTTDMTMESMQRNGGAAIGLGYGTTIEGTKKGTIKILDNATIYAVASHHAQAIGASGVVGKLNADIEPAIAELENIQIDSTANVIAISDGYADAVANASNFVSLNFSEEFYEKNDNVLDDSAFPVTVDTNSYTFGLQNKNKANVMVHLANTSDYSFSINDIKNDEGNDIYLANNTNKRISSFDTNSSSKYDVSTLTSAFNGNKKVESKYGTLNVRIEAEEGIFELGSEFDASVITDEEIINKLNSNIDSKKNLDKSLFLDLNVINPSGTAYTNLAGKVKIYIEIPEGWNKDLLKAIYITDADDEELVQNIEEIDGVYYLVFEISHFSNYGVLQYNVSESSANTSLIKNPDTSDNIYAYVMLLVVSLLSIISVRVLKENN